MASRFKTQLCKYHLEGYCTYGNRCRFAHGDQELRVGKHPYRMEKYQKERCKNLFREGLCLRGAACWFKHKEQVLSCPFYEATGRCYGNCSFDHPPPVEE